MTCTATCPCGWKTEAEDLDSLNETLVEHYEECDPRSDTGSSKPFARDERVEVRA